jgi:hypothetical protein
MKISIAILIVGMATVAAYWYIPSSRVDSQNKQTNTYTKEHILLPQFENSVYQKIPEVDAYISDVQEMITKGGSVLPLDDSELDTNAKKVQTLLLQNKDFLKDTREGKKILHNDMMRIIPAIRSSMDKKAQKSCLTHMCYQAEKYNFVTNATTRAIVNVDTMQVVSVVYYPQMQTDISLRLTNIAKAIALNAPEVKSELGKIPTKQDVTMVNVRGTMKESPCDNTNHLCVAPTFVDHQKEQALWAVVDLTELRLAAAKWAGLGKTSTPACISERSLQNRYIMEHFCQKDTVLEKNGWSISYRLTGSDGLEIHHVTFKGEPVLDSAKIVDWHVSYKQKGAESLDTTTETYMEGRRVDFVRGEGSDYLFGYNDAMGCPMFSTSVVLTFNAPQVKELKNKDGFMLTQDFRNPKWPMACNYRYENRFEFYNDGSFRVVGANKGRGCGANAIYRPVMRIDIAVGKKENFYSYDTQWKLWEKEASQKIPPESQQLLNEGKYPYKIVSDSDGQQGYYIEPNYGQFKDNSRGDNATLFVTKFKHNEGEQDLLTLGSCCDLKDDGVERYLQKPEKIQAENIVLWYVPRIHNDAQKGQEYCWADTVIGDDGNLKVKVWPCIVGPKFIPITQR